MQQGELQPAAGVGAGVGFYRPGLLRGERCRAWSLEAQTGRLFPKASSSSARSCGLDAGIPGRSSCQEDKQDHIRPGTFSPPTRAPGSRVCSGGAGPDGARLGVRLPGRAGPNLALPRAAQPGLHLRHGRDKTGSAPPGCPRGSPHPWRYVPGTDTPQGPRGGPARCPQLWLSSSREQTPERRRCHQAGRQPPQNPAGTHNAWAAPRQSVLPVPPALRQGGRRKFLPDRASSGARQPGSCGPVPPPRSPPTHPLGSARLAGLPPVSLTHRLRRAASRERARGSLEPRREGLPSLSLTSGSCSWMGPGHS